MYEPHHHSYHKYETEKIRNGKGSSRDLKKGECNITPACLNSGGSRIFQTGAPTSHGAITYYLANFSRKLHENEEILGQRDKGARPTRPPDPPLKNIDIRGIIQ